MKRNHSFSRKSLSCFGVAILVAFLLASIPLSETLWAKRLGVYGSIHVRKSHGCKPGFWYHEDHFKHWPEPYTPHMKFVVVFERELPGDPTLLLALHSKGNGMDALARQAATSLLNAEVESVEYTLSRKELVAMFQTAFDSGDPTQIEALTERLRKTNDGFCTLMQDGELEVEGLDKPTGTSVSTTQTATDTATSTLESTPSAAPTDVPTGKPGATSSATSTATSTVTSTATSTSTSTSTPSTTATNTPTTTATNTPAAEGTDSP